MVYRPKLTSRTLSIASKIFLSFDRFKPSFDRFKPGLNRFVVKTGFDRSKPNPARMRTLIVGPDGMPGSLDTIRKEKCENAVFIISLHIMYFQSSLKCADLELLPNLTAYNCEAQWSILELRYISTDIIIIIIIIN